MKTMETTNTISTRIKELTDELVRYNIAYYQNHQSLIPDERYDMLLKELEALEKEYPDLRLSYSPTQHVGSDKSAGFSTVTHLIPMQSLENTYNETEITQFMTFVQKAFPDASFVTEFKIDGLSISCIYQDGKLVQASTRGDGNSGDDVTRNVMYIQDIPKELPFEREFGVIPHLFEIRGEVFMTYHDFEEANKKRAKKGLELLANPRNAASGTLKSLDTSVFKERQLHALFYHVANADELPLTQSDMFYTFDRLGIPHAPFYYSNSQADVLKAIGKIAQLRQQMPYPTDGAVVKVNQFSMRPKLGTTAKYPRWAKAYKFAAEQARTKLKDITIQVGRTGTLTPVAELEPVNLGGSVVKRATLHNSDMIRKLDVRIGDMVLLEKAGEVIPHILCSISHSAGSKPYYLFEQVHGKCPVCGCGIVRKEDEVAWKCVNDLCPARVEEQIVYATGKHALDINCLGRAIVRALIKHHGIQSFAQLFDLSKDAFVHLPMEDGSYLGVNGEKIYESLQQAKQKNLANWITSFGISGVGPIVAKSIASNYTDLLDFSVKFKPNVDSVVENNVSQWLATTKLVHDLLDRKINPISIGISRGPFYGKTFVITGKLSLPRIDVEKMITDRSGTISNSVSKNTTFLIQGEDKRISTKVKKAKELGIIILTESQFNEMLNN